MGSRFREDSPKPLAGVAVLFAAPQLGSLQNNLEKQKSKTYPPKPVSSEAKILGLNRILTITEEGRRRSLKWALDMVTNYESVRLSFKVRFTPLLTIVNSKVAAQQFAVMKILIASSYGLNPDEIGRSSQRTSIISTDSKFSMVWRNPQRMEGLQDPQFNQLQTSDANIEGMDSFVQKILDQSPNEKESLLESEELAKIINSGDFQENSADGFGMSGSRLKSSCLSEELAYLADLAGNNRRSNRLEDLLNLKTSDSQRRLDRASKIEPLANTLTRIFHTKSNMHKRVGMARITSRCQERLQISRMVGLLSQALAHGQLQTAVDQMSHHSRQVVARQQLHMHLLDRTSLVCQQLMQRVLRSSWTEIDRSARERRMSQLLQKVQGEDYTEPTDPRSAGLLGLSKTFVLVVRSLMNKKILLSVLDVLKTDSKEQRILQGVEKMEEVIMSRAARGGIRRLLQHSQDFLKTITLSYKLFPRLSNICEDRCRYVLQRLQEFNERVANIQESLGNLADELQDKFELEKRCAFNAIFDQQNNHEFLNHTRILGLKLEKLTKKRLENGLQEIADRAAFLILIEDICSKYHLQTRASFFSELRICSKRVNTMLHYQQHFDSPDESPDEREDKFEYCKKLNMPRIQSEEEPLQTPLLKKNFMMDSDGDIRSGIFDERGNGRTLERKVSLALSAKLQRSVGSMDASARQIQLLSAGNHARLRSGAILLQTIVQIAAFKRFAAGFESLKQAAVLRRQQMLLKLVQLLGRLLDRQRATIFRKLQSHRLSERTQLEQTEGPKEAEPLMVLEGRVFSSLQSECCELEPSGQEFLYQEDSQAPQGEEEEMDPDQYILAQILQAENIPQSPEIDLQIKEAIQDLDDATPENLHELAIVPTTASVAQKRVLAIKKRSGNLTSLVKEQKSFNQKAKPIKSHQSQPKLESMLHNLGKGSEATPLERRRLYPVTPLGDSIAQEDWLNVNLPENDFEAFCLKRKFVHALIEQNDRVIQTRTHVTPYLRIDHQQMNAFQQLERSQKHEHRGKESSKNSILTSANQHREKITSGNLLQRTNSTQKKFQSITKMPQEVTSYNTGPYNSSSEELTSKKKHALSKSSVSEIQLQGRQKLKEPGLITTKYSFDLEPSSVSQVASMQGRINAKLREQPIKDFDNFASQQFKSTNLHELFLKSKLKLSADLHGNATEKSSYNYEGNSTEKTTQKPSSGLKKLHAHETATKSAKELEVVATARNKASQRQASARNTKESLITLGDLNSHMKSSPSVLAAPQGLAAQRTSDSKGAHRNSSSRIQGPSVVSDERCTFGIPQTQQSSSRPTGGSSYRLVRGTNTGPSDSDKQRHTGELANGVPHIGSKGLEQVHARFGFATLGTETGRFGSLQY